MSNNMKIYLKKAVLLLALTAILSAPFTASAQENEYYYADVNCDGVVNVADMVIVIDYILKGESGTIKPDPDKTYVSAREYGAVGDGITDDTHALENLFAAACQLKKTVFFEPGTYLIKRSLMLQSGMEICGSEATLMKKQAVTTMLTANAVKGQTSIEVADASGFNEGDQFFIADDAGVDGCTCGIVESIVGNTINFTNVINDCQTSFPGCVGNHPSGCMVSTSFALLRSWTARHECDGVSIHDLTLDGNRVDSEPCSWANSCIYMDVYRPEGFTAESGIEYRNIQRNLFARNLVIRNSPGDGITDYSQGGLVVRDCVIENSAMHGIHMGENCSRAMIYNNRLNGNGTVGSGVFFSQTVNDAEVDNNEITAFAHGCGMDESEACVKSILVRRNQFNDITGDVFAFSTSSAHSGGMLQISNNTIQGLGAVLFTATNLDDILLDGNEVKTITVAPPSVLQVIQCKNVIVSANQLPSGAAISTPVISTGSIHVIESSNSWN